MPIYKLLFPQLETYYTIILWLPSIAASLRYFKWCGSLLKRENEKLPDNADNDKSEDLNIISEQKINEKKLAILGSIVRVSSSKIVTFATEIY